MAGITVNAYPVRTSTRTLTLTGTNDSRISSLYLGGVDGGIDALTTTSWKAEIKLSNGQNDIIIYGVDTSGNTTANLELTITLNAIDPEVYQVFNSFSEHGIPRALQQIKGEKNYLYRNRLLDVKKRPGTPSMTGLHHGINRELSLKYYPGLKIRSLMFTDGSFGATSASAEIDGNKLILQCNEMYTKDELVQVEPATDTVYLSRYPILALTFRIYDLSGGIVPYNDYEVDWKEKEVLFLDPKYRDQRLRVSYHYKEVIELYDKNLEELATEIEAFTINGRQLFEAAFRCASWEAAGLFQGKYPIAIERSWNTFWWARLRIRELHNHWFRNYILNDDGAAYGTKLQAWFEEINSRAQILWGDTQLDKHYWNVIPENIKSYGSLPHLWDNKKGHWRCPDPSHGTEYTIKDFLRYNGTCPTHALTLEYQGVMPLQFQSGTGTGDDLKTIIYGFES